MKKQFLLYSFLLISNTAVFSQKRITPAKTPEERLNEAYCTGMFNTIDGTYFDMLNDNAAIGATSYLNILDWLQGRVAGLQVYTTKDGDRLAFIRGRQAGIYVDEMPWYPGSLNALAVSDIAMIKIIKGPFAGGFNNGGGVIAIYTIRGEDEEESDDE
ncbi:MAG: TonB-dependent receptor plug domain-containing protein [Bacteroidota bacterium]